MLYEVITNINKQGFIDEMKSVISEFYQYSIDQDRFDSMLQAAKDRPVLLRKLKDIHTIQKAFSEFLEERYITTEEILDLLSYEIEHSARIVITSYSIHYTKLYELGRNRRERGCTSARRDAAAGRNQQWKDDDQ